MPARGGTVLKAIYLKKKHNLNYTKFISLTTGAYLIGSFLASLSAIFFILINFLFYGIFYGKLFLISLSLSIVTLIFISIVKFFEISHILRNFPKIQKLIQNVEKGLSLFKGNNNLLAKIVVFKFLFIFIMGLKLYCAFIAIGIETNLLTILIIQSLAVFSMFISLTPGNLGIREGIIGLLSAILDIPLKKALFGAFIDRAAMMCIVIFLGLIFTRILATTMERHISETEKNFRPAKLP